MDPHAAKITAESEWHKLASIQEACPMHEWTQFIASKQWPNTNLWNVSIKLRHSSLEMQPSIV